MRSKLILQLFVCGCLVGADRLDHTRWMVHTVTPAELWPKEMTATITFDEGRAMYSGCNESSGKYSVEDGRLSAQFLASTKRACQADREKADQAFWAAFRAGGAFRFAKEGHVVILDAGEKGRWTLLKLALAPKGAVTKFLYVSGDMLACPGDATRMCLQVREKPEGPWRVTPFGIIGFSPKPGMEYRLRIQEDKGPEGPVWYHDLTVEQKAAKK